MTSKTPAATPAQLYLAGLSEGSKGMRQSLDIIAGILSDDHDADSFPWQEVTYRESMAVRIALAERNQRVPEWTCSGGAGRQAQPALRRNRRQARRQSSHHASREG